MKMRKILAAVLAFGMVCGASADIRFYQQNGCFTADAADTVASGECGKKLTWALDSEGTEATTTEVTTAPVTTTAAAEPSDSRFVGKWELYKYEINGKAVSFSPAAFELYADGNGKWTSGGKTIWTAVDGFLYVKDLDALPIHINKYEYVNGELLWRGEAEVLDSTIALETAEYYSEDMVGVDKKIYYRRVENAEQTTTAEITTATTTTTTTTETTTTEVTTTEVTTTETTTTETASQPVVPALSGDADGDGSVTLKDATAAMKQYNQTEILGEDGFMSAQQIENADLDGDGAVTAKDATYIQKYVNFNVVLEEPKTWEEIISPKNA